MFLSDLLALAVGMGIALWVVFGGIAPATWQVPAGASLWPLASLMLGGAVAGSYISRLAWANAAPRPSYGRALAIALITASVAAIGIVIFRPYWSRPLFGVTIVTFLGLMLAHRAVRRQRPWSESMVIVTGEKQLAEDIRDTDHAEVIAVLDPTERCRPVKRRTINECRFRNRCQQLEGDLDLSRGAVEVASHADQHVDIGRHDDSRSCGRRLRRRLRRLALGLR